MEEGNSSLHKSPGGCLSDQNWQSTRDDICKLEEIHMEQLFMARKIGSLESCPEDEAEGELIYFQHKLLQNAVARKRFAGIFICSSKFLRTILIFFSHFFSLQILNSLEFFVLYLTCIGAWQFSSIVTTNHFNK